MIATPFEDADTQGLVRFGYKKLPEACFLLLGIDDAAAARAWLTAAPVANAVARPAPPATALQVAFTRGGLERLGVPPKILAGFSSEFNAGLSGEESRSRRLGDVGSSAPAAWEWGGPGRVPDVLVMLYAQPGRLAAWKDSIERELREAGCRVWACLPTSDLGGVEPFGFADGISQPEVDFERRLEQGSADALAYGNVLALGEVLLGYPNEYGKYTDRPLIPRARNDEGVLAPAEDDPDRLDFGRNGTYLVFRHLRQDVRAFWQFLDRSARSDPKQRTRLGEWLVGRRMTGEPLEPKADSAIPGVGPDADDIRLNGFTYDGDADGARCPFGAHVRRANPRNGDLSGVDGPASVLLRTLGLKRLGVRDDLIASARFHRIIRRGREFGPGLSPEEALEPAPPGDPERGLQFICLNANITRQFEFIQNAWIMNTKFDGLVEEGDPLLGSREPVVGCPVADAFSLTSKNGIRPRLTGLPRFVTVRGGGYFFLPGLRALRFLASTAASGVP